MLDHLIHWLLTCRPELDPEMCVLTAKRMADYILANPEDAHRTWTEIERFSR